MRRTVIGVMGPASASPALEDTAFQLGQLVAQNGWILLTGGRRAGIMDAASRGAKGVAGSLTIGILPGDYESDDVSEHVDVAVFTNMGDARNAINVQSSDAVVAFGAATPGTLAEIALALKAGRHVIVVAASEQVLNVLHALHPVRVHGAVDADDAVVRIKSLGIHSGPPWAA